MSLENKEIAKIVHEANKAYCAAIGDNSQVFWEITPPNIKESAMEGVEFMRNNPEALPKDMHDNWVKFKTNEGWVYGDHKSVMRKTHPCLVNYSDLSEEQKVKDRIFIAITRIMLDAD